MAVWVSQAAADLVSKATAIILIITIFASLGFEHSVANMFVGKEGGREGGREGVREGGSPEIFTLSGDGPVDDALSSPVFFADLADRAAVDGELHLFFSVWPPKFISWRGADKRMKDSFQHLLDLQVLAGGGLK